MACVVGIDPGKKGGVCVWHEEGFSAHEMFVMANGEIDSRGLYNELQGYDVDYCIIEKAQSMPQQGVKSTFAYGKGYGEIVAVLKILEIPYEEVQPQKWKKQFALIKKGKRDSVTVATKLFPSIEFITPRGRLMDGKAEACLIANFALRRYKGELLT
jgi:crossover junction endodeoxyribonuclease RuvC